MDDRYEIADQNGMSREFADWFFDNKKDGCGNVWFMMMAAMWEGWQASRAAVEVVFPKQIKYDDPISAYNAIIDCAEAIRAAGIKVKE